MDMVFKKKLIRKVKFRKKLKLWRFRESEVKKEFAEGVNNKCDKLSKFILTNKNTKEIYGRTKVKNTIRFPLKNPTLVYNYCQC